MADFNDEYYFLQDAPDDWIPSLTANEDTVERNYTFTPQLVGSKPFVFVVEAAERRQGVKIMELPEILFNGSFPVVSRRIRDALLRYEIPSLHMHPSVFIDASGTWHEDLWFMAFSERFDCWDRKESNYEEEPLELGGYKLHSVYSYSLDRQVMSAMPLERRLLFQMGGTQDAVVVCHSSIARLFRSAGKAGATLTPIAEY